jgi:hypothetical protein
MKAYLGTKTAIAKVLPSRTPEARKAYNKAYYEKTKEARQEYNKKYYAEHKDEVNAAVAAWREANPEKVKGYRQEYYKNNTAKAKARTVAWQKKHRNLGKKTDDGHIYIFQTDPNGPFKIGYTGRAVKFRVYEAQRDNFHPVIVVYESGFIKNARQLEAELHEMFKDKNVRGEWYNLNKTNIKNLKTFVNKKVTTK